MHVVADFLILQHELGSVPRISCYGAVYSCSSGVVVALYSIDHETIQKLIYGSDWLSFH